MPRTAFALPCAPHEEAAWRHAAAQLMESGAREHRAFLGDRGIFRERVWLQQGGFDVPVTLVLWDCDDVDVARGTGDAPATAHERWIAEVVLGRFHDRTCQGEGALLPSSALLAGSTTAATAVAESQTLVALPIPPGRAAPVRSALAGVEDGAAGAAHQAFLANASIREEWVWVQPGGAVLPDLLLLHWIGDDLDAPWRVLADPGGDPGATRFREVLTDLLDIAPATAGSWPVEHLLAMHVRRSDTGQGAAIPVARRIATALGRGGWSALERTFGDAVDLGGGPVGRAEAAAHLRSLVEGRGAVVTDVLPGRSQVVVTLADPVGGPVAVILGVDDGTVASLSVLVDRPR